MNVLDRIVDATRADVARRRQAVPLAPHADAVTYGGDEEVGRRVVEHLNYVIYLGLLIRWPVLNAQVE